MATRVHLAAVRGYLGEIVGLLQADPGLLEAEDITGGTPLIFAAMRGQVVIVRYLLEHGANVNGRDSKGRTALYVACWGRHRAVVDMLLKHGATLSIADHKGTTPLMRACSEGDVDIVRAVIKRSTHTDVDAHNARGRTPLWYAVQWSRKEVVRVLLLQGADPCVDVNDQSYGAEEAHHRARVAHSCAIFLKSYVRVYVLDRARRIHDDTAALHTAAQLHHHHQQQQHQLLSTHYRHTATLPPPPPPTLQCVVPVPRYLSKRGVFGEKRKKKGCVSGAMGGVCTTKGGGGPIGGRVRASSLSPPRPPSPSCTALMVSRAFSCSSLVSSPSRFRLTTSLSSSSRPASSSSSSSLMSSSLMSSSSPPSSQSRFRMSTSSSSSLLSSPSSSSRSLSSTSSSSPPPPSSSPMSSPPPPLPASSSSSSSSSSLASSSSSSSSASPPTTSMSSSSPSSPPPSSTSSSTSSSSAKSLSSSSSSSSSCVPLPVVEVISPLPPRIEGCLFTRPAITQEAKRSAGQRAVAAAVLQHTVQELKPELYTEMMACLGWMDG